MPKPDYFIFLGCPADGEFLEPDTVVGWTTHKAAVENDRIFFYITAPVSAIVARGVKSGEDWTHEPDDDSKWSGRTMTDAVIDRTDLHITMSELRSLFPEWAWLRYPRQNTQIPADIVGPFLELIERSRNSQPV